MIEIRKFYYIILVIFLISFKILETNGIHNKDLIDPDAIDEIIYDYDI